MLDPATARFRSFSRAKDTEPRKGAPAASASWRAPQGGASDLLSEPAQGRRAGRCRKMTAPGGLAWRTFPLGTWEEGPYFWGLIISIMSTTNRSKLFKLNDLQNLEIWNSDAVFITRNIQFISRLAFNRWGHFPLSLKFQDKIDGRFPG